MTTVLKHSGDSEWITPEAYLTGLFRNYNYVLMLSKHLIPALDDYLHSLLLLRILFALICDADEGRPILEVAWGEQLVPSMAMLALLVAIAEAPAGDAQILGVER